MKTLHIFYNLSYMKIRIKCFCYFCIFSLLFLMLFWIIYCQFISMFYASLIKASLTIPSIYQPITSLADVINSGLEYTLFTDPVEEELWKQSSNPMIRNEYYCYRLALPHEHIVKIWFQTLSVQVFQLKL